MVGPMYRMHECWHCKITYVRQVEFSVNTNLSGEKSQYCPKCFQRSNVSYPMYSLNGEGIEMSKMLENENIHLTFPDWKWAICHSTAYTRLNLVNWRDMETDIAFFKRTNREYIQNYYCENCLEHLEVYISRKQKEKYTIYEKERT